MSRYEYNECKKCSTCQQYVALKHYRSDKSKKDEQTDRCEVCDKAANWRTRNKKVFLWIRDWANSQLPGKLRYDR